MEKQKLPHSQAALTLGIISIITACCCYGTPGLILGIIGMLQAKKAKEIHDANPDMYDGIKNAETGKIISIIGIVIGGLSTLWMIYAISTGKWAESMEQMQELMEEMQNQ